jgi:RinA family phage transcriptional activator
MRLSNDVKNMLEEIADIAVTKAMRRRSPKQGVNYFKLTEKVLYKYQDLKSYIDDEEAYIQNYLDEKPRRSKDIVFFSSNKGQSQVESVELIRDRARENLRITKAFCARIDMSLKRLKVKEVAIIEELYLNKTTNADELASKMYVDRRTLFRHKKKIIERIGDLLFGSAPLDI